MSCKILSENKISNKDFLKLMIKHHNAAIKMSRLIQMNSDDDFILYYARKIIYNQGEEVILMERLLKSIPNIQVEKFNCICNNSLLGTNIDKFYPKIFSNIKCDDHHFKDLDNEPLQLRKKSEYKTKGNANINNHNKMNSIILSDKEYINHMVAHHKSGVDLSKLLLKSTSEPRLLSLAQTIILDQEKEMFQLKNLYSCTKYNWRK